MHRRVDELDAPSPPACLLGGEGLARVKRAVDVTKARVRKLADNTEWIFGRRASRVLGVVALFTVVVTLLLVFLNWYVAPTKPSERKDLVNSTGSRPPRSRPDTHASRRSSAACSGCVAATRLTVFFQRIESLQQRRMRRLSQPATG